METPIYSHNIIYTIYIYSYNISQNKQQVTFMATALHRVPPESPGQPQEPCHAPQVFKLLGDLVAHPPEKVALG